MSIARIPNTVVALLVMTFLISSGMCAETPSIVWTFGNVGSSSYRLDAFSPANVDFSPLGTQDPTLPLELGKRYQVRVINYRQHPFEVLAKAASPGQDQVLLSMAVADLWTGDIQELLVGHQQQNLNLFVKGFGQDHDGEIYLLASTALGPFGTAGGVYRLVAAQTRFAATLTASPAGTDSLATGQALLTLNPDHTQFSYQLAVQGVDNVTMAHIHIANTPGGNGPPAVWLYPATPPAALIAGQFNGSLAAGNFGEANLVGPLAGTSLVDLLDAIQQGRAYVNVHTEQSPGGEIRGQLK